MSNTGLIKGVTFILILTFISIPIILASQVGLSSDPLPVSVSLQNINDSSYRMVLTCPDAPLQYLERDSQRRVWLEYQNEGMTTEEGKAALPLVTKWIAIPPNSRLKATVIHRDTRSFDNIDIVPVVENADDPLTRDWNDDPTFLLSESQYPSQSITVGEGMRLRNLWLVPITVAPAKYYPRDRRLEIDHSMEIELTLQSGQFHDPSLVQGPLVESFHELFQAVVANYDLLSLDQEPIRGTYLIICPNDQSVVDDLQPLIEWKHRRGYPVVLATTAETGTSYSSIREYIRDAYNHWERPPEFVCLVGDISGTIAIPTNYTQYDHYYSMMDDDILADVCVGRLSVSTNNELHTVVNKILSYEMLPYMSQTEWYQRALMVVGSGSGTSPIHTKRSIRYRLMQNQFVQVDTMWYTMSGSIVTAIANGFNNGISYLNYRGYLGMSGWDNDDTNNLFNGFMIPVVVTLTCGTGTFTSGTCLTEGFLRAGTPLTPKGGVAAIGTATTGTHTRYNNCMDVAVFAGLFDEGMAHLGEGLVRGKLELVRNYPADNTATSHIYWNNLMGDPGLVVWKGVPIGLTVEHDDTIALGSNVFHIRVLDEVGNPVESAYVCLWQEDQEMYELGYTDQNGDIDLNCGDALLGNFFVTVTKPDYIPYLSEASVITMTQAAGISSHPIDDDTNGQSQGNSDGNWNPGERIEIQPTLWNRGTQQLQDVQATLFSDNDLITVIQGTGNFGTIASGDSAQMTGVFVVDMDPVFPEAALSRLRMELTGSGFSQTLFLDYYTVSYQLMNGVVTVVDANGRLEPGETSNITIPLKNSGSFPGNSITALLRADTAFVTVVDSLAEYGTIAIGATVENGSDPFTLTAHGSVIPGTFTDLTVITTSSEGIIDTVYPRIRILAASSTGEPWGPDDYGYFCFDDTDFNNYPAYAPQYSWIEISGIGNVVPLTDYGNEDDDTELVLLPFLFNYYGRAYDRISVCSNGWLSMGNHTNFVNFRNWIIPSPLGPPAMIAPFWDDLIVDQSGPGRVYTWFNETNHLFLVEWYQCENRGTGNPRETFQVILYDPIYHPTPSGDGDIVFQYQQITNVPGVSSDNNYATVGIEDFDQFVGIEYSYDNGYPPEAAPLVAGRAIKFTTALGLTPNPPIISINPNQFSFSVVQGLQETEQLRVANRGESNLYFTINIIDEFGHPFAPFPRPTTWQYQDFTGTVNSNYQKQEPKGSRGESGFPVVDDYGGPDAYGYTWMDSDEPEGPEYSWVDITSAGTAIAWQIDPDEESFGPLDIGFNFPFYGTLYNTLRICSNGYISFVDDTAQYANRSLPSFDAPAALIAPWWDDLNPEHGGEFYYWSNNIDSFVVTIDSIQDWRQEGLYYFQAILTSSGNIKFQYQDMGTGRLDEETIGIQDETRTIGLTVAHNTLYVHNQLAVEFKPPLTWLQVEPDQGTLFPGDSMFCDVTVNTLLIEPGNYFGTLRINSNDLQQPSIDVNVELQVIPSGNEPPTVLDIPNQTVNEGEIFQNIELNNYVNDPVYSPSDITWTTFGALDLTVTIVDQVATINIPNEDWFGEETITFRATNPLNLWDSDPATFTVLSVNDPPVIDPLLPDIQIPPDTIATLDLDDYGYDVEDPDSLLTWSCTGNVEVEISIDTNHIASFSGAHGAIPVVEEIIFTLEDTEHATAVDTISVILLPSTGIAGIDPIGIPKDYFLAQNYPNPFNPQTVIRFGLPEPSQVKIIIYNIMGQVVDVPLQEHLTAGYHHVIFQNTELSSGLYFFSLSTTEFRATRKMILLR